MDNLRASLAFFSKEELSVLQKIVKSEVNDINNIIYKLERLLLSNLWGIFQKNDSYKEFIKKIANHNNILIDLKSSEGTIERDLYFKLFDKELNQMSADEKEAFYISLENQGLTRAQATSLAGLATIGAAQASGFGVYILASSTVGAIASVVGVTLPFALYTTLSSAISYLIGPIGFLAIGYSLYKNIKSLDDFFDILTNSYNSVKKFIVGDYERATLALKYIAAMRFVLEVNFEKVIDVSKSNREDLQKNKLLLNQEIIKNNSDLKVVYDEIYVVEQKLKALNSEKAIINFKNKNLQNKIEENNINQTQTERLIYDQEKKLANFKLTLYK